MAVTASIIRNPVRKIARRTRGHSHGPITRLMSPSDFGQLLNSAIGSVSQAGARAESAITNATMGKADLVDVVTAVSAAEATMETVVAVRDEVIKAYNDIMRMPI